MRPETIGEPLSLLEGLRESQQRAVLSVNPLVVVGAGAGTGKTRTLAARFAWLVTRHGIDVTEILTLTFTEKAAQEMADRIGDTLTRWASRLRRLGAEAEADRLDEAVSRLAEAPISTIHSFAYDVVRRNALHLGLPPGTSLPTAPDEEAFWRSVTEALERLDRNWFAERLGGAWEQAAALLDDDGIRSLLEAGRTEEIVALARSTAALFGSRALGPGDLPRSEKEMGTVDDLARRQYRSRHSPLWREACRWWSGAMEAVTPDGKGTSRAEPLFAGMKASWTEPDDDGLAEAVLRLVAFLREAAGSSGAKIYRAAQAAVESLSEGRFRRLVDLRDALSDNGALEAFFLLGDTERAAEDRRRRALLLALSGLLWALWREEKRRRGLFDFDDMIRLGRDVLRLRPEGTPAFKAILVDEFQDTDIVQGELISAAAEAARRSGDCSLFVVGDLKQSIYRFRHAEPDLFADYIVRARSGAPKGTSYEALTESFRSRSAHLDVVNGLFGHIWREGLTAKNPLPYEALAFPDDLPWWERRDGTTETPHLTLLMEAEDGDAPEGLDEKEIDGSHRRRLARALALTLETMKGRPLWDGETAEARPATWRDMAVLVPTRNAYALLEEVFCWERGLPAVFLGRKAFFSRGEVRDAVCLLRALADDGDDLALAGWLASPFSGLSLETATALTDAALDRQAPLARLLAEREPETASRLERMRRRALVLGPARLLEELTAQAAPFMMLAPYQRRRALANLRRAVDRAREYETARGRSLRGCADYMARGAEEQGSLEEAPVLGEREDVIRVMTVHAAKGLEFPIVALTGLERRKSQGRGESLTPSRFVGIAQAKGDSESPLPSKSLHDALEGEDLVEENRRLFYVAATRARESLILCGLLPPRKSDGKAPDLPRGSWLADVASWLAAERGDPSPEGLYAALREHSLPREAWLAGETVRPRREERPRLRGTTPPQGEPHLEWTGASAFALYSFCPYAYRLRYRLEMPLEWDSESLADDDEPRRESPWPQGHPGPGRLPWGAAAFGSLVHHLLGRVWDLTPEGLAGTLPPPESEAAKRLEGDMPRELRPLWRDETVRRGIEERLETFASTDLCRSLASLLREGRLKREHPFRVSLEGGPSLRGAIDLFWDDGILRLRDFKTGAPSEAGDLLYERQLAFYGLALGLLEGKEAQPGLIGLDGKERLFEAADAKATERAVRDFARLAVTGPFPARADRCPICPWREGCPGRKTRG